MLVYVYNLQSVDIVVVSNGNVYCVGIYNL